MKRLTVLKVTGVSGGHLATNYTKKIINNLVAVVALTSGWYKMDY